MTILAKIYEETQGVYGEDQKGPYDAHQAAEALTTARGNISLAARMLGRSRRSFAEYISKHPIMMEILQELRQEILDVAEYNYATAVLLGNLEASKYVLHQFGRDRGYSADKNGQGGGASGDVPPQITVVFVEAPGNNAKVIDGETVEVKPSQKKNARITNS